MHYAKYIRSAVWRNNPARLAELAASGGRCRTCNGAAPDVELQVHHRTYARLGAERVGDLTTLCVECHRVITDLLRRRRYGLRSPQFSDVSSSIASWGPLDDPTRPIPGFDILGALT
jgi:5-methylcytosine-specific restriction endonuclease McrA